jgi:membrane complex biogenesis BtpA family protein
MSELEAVLSRRKLLLGVVHLKPLPGSPRYGGEPLAGLTAAARADAEALLEAGFDGYVLENFGDAPFFPREVPPHTIAAMTRIACELPRAGAFVAVNVLRNDAAGALAIAAAADLQAIRVNIHAGAMVTDQGLIEGRAAETLRLRQLIVPGAAILADVDVKHAVALGAAHDLREAARDAAYRGLADALIVTGKATGSPAARDDLKAVREAVPDRPLLVGSGVDEKTAREWLQLADGIIVGSALKRQGRVEMPVDPQRAKRFVGEARGKA